ncbi:hypothetical protein IFM89_018068 [Coptis chinensis]|uniref:Uncharacterized protein n=1 Tax=Coptis chinensis TaxID=261450 RepID=A0A835I8E0_9MAGN|nr:hypothetical protein IFM89_018068 [Coptis chinensis]
MSVDHPSPVHSQYVVIVSEGNGNKDTCLLAWPDMRFAFKSKHYTVEKQIVTDEIQSNVARKEEKEEVRRDAIPLAKIPGLLGCVLQIVDDWRDIALPTSLKELLG